MIVIIWAIAITAALVLYYRQVYSKFSDHGVKNLRPIAPFGNIYRMVFRTGHIAYETTKMYHMFPNDRFIGSYEFTKPMIIIRDLELLKRIAIKDFEHFLDHRVITNSVIEPFFQRNLFSLRGQEWKDMRSTLSPAFTSSKIRLMVPFMEEAGKQMMSAMKRNIEESGEKYKDFDCKDLTTRYANDVIASCAFGLKVDSHNARDNEFYKMGKTAATFKFRQMLIFLLFGAFPWIGKILRLKIFSNETKEFFLHLVLDTMKNREINNIFRPDMIHLLMEAKKGQLQHDEKEANGTVADAGFATVEESSVGKKDVNKVWSDTDLVAQAVLFFIAGFETVSAVMSFALHEIALHPEVQEKLANEIKEHEAKHGGKMDYNSIQNMTYMDMVVSEVLRLWPSLIVTDRNCNKSYNLGKPNDKATKDYILQSGDVIQIPIWAIHHDPEYFPNPEKFDPERFSKENKHLINPLTYMPFGLGPRNCIGSRFALCEIKIFVYSILRDMVLTPSSKVVLPARLSYETFNTRLEGGHWVRFNVRH